MIKPKKSKQIYATQRNLDETRGELKAQIISSEIKLSGKIETLRSDVDIKIQDLRTELKAEIAEVRSDLSEIKTEVKNIQSGIHRIIALVEEQNARNLYVLDGYQSLYDRQDRVEKDVIEIKAVLKL